VNWRESAATVVGHRAFVPAVLAVGAVLRLGLILTIDNQQRSDCAWFFDRGRDLAAGLGYSMPARPGQFDAAGRLPTAYWPVGYPAFLGGLFSLFGPSVLAGQAANLLLSLGSALVGGRLAAESFGEQAGRITTLLLAVYPNHIAYSAILYSEPLFVFLLLTAMLLRARAQATRRWWPGSACSGVIFGLAALTKPQVVLLPAFLMAFDIIRSFLRRDGGRRARRNVAMTGIVYVCIVATIAPWLVRNHRTFGRVVISTNSGRNLLIGNHPGASGAYMHALGRPYPEVFELEDESESDLAATAAALRFVRDEPIEALLLWPKKLSHLYTKDVEGFYWIGAGLSGEQLLAQRAVFAMKVIAQVCYLLAWVGFVAALFKQRKPRGHAQPSCAAAGGALAVIGYFTLVYLPYFGDSRFHYPAMPFVLMFGAADLAGRLRAPVISGGGKFPADSRWLRV
jgi:hypothetical protein